MLRKDESGRQRERWRDRASGEGESQEFGGSVEASIEIGLGREYRTRVRKRELTKKRVERFDHPRWSRAKSRLETCRTEIKSVLSFRKKRRASTHHLASLRKLL